MIQQMNKLKSGMVQDTSQTQICGLFLVKLIDTCSIFAQISFGLCCLYIFILTGKLLYNK